MAARGVGSRCAATRTSRPDWGHGKNQGLGRCVQVGSAQGFVGLTVARGPKGGQCWGKVRAEGGQPGMFARPANDQQPTMPENVSWRSISARSSTWLLGWVGVRTGRKRDLRAYRRDPAACFRGGVCAEWFAVSGRAAASPEGPVLRDGWPRVLVVPLFRLPPAARAAIGRGTGSGRRRRFLRGGRRLRRRVLRNLGVRLPVTPRVSGIIE
jgi:hypothetical protein